MRMIKIIDTRPDFDQFLDEGALSVARYMQVYFEPHRSVLEGLANTHLKSGMNELTTKISELDFEWYKAQASKLKERQFLDKTSSILEHALKIMSPDNDYEIVCYLVYGFGTMTGCSSFVDGNVVLLIGLEWVAEYDRELAYEYFLIHELHHVLRYKQQSVIEEAAQMKLNDNQISNVVAQAIVKNTTLGVCFVDEGLASLAPVLVTGTELDEITQCRMLFMPPEHIRQIRDREEELMSRAKALFNSNHQDVIYEWTFTDHGIQTDVPERALYYLGLKAMHSLVKEGRWSFAELSKMTAEEILSNI